MEFENSPTKCLFSIRHLFGIVLSCTYNDLRGLLTEVPLDDHLHKMLGLSSIPHCYKNKTLDCLSELIKLKKIIFTKILNNSTTTTNVIVKTCLFYRKK